MCFRQHIQAAKTLVHLYFKHQSNKWIRQKLKLKIRQQKGDIDKSLSTANMVSTL